jgi:hypothetical protein
MKLDGEVLVFLSIFTSVLRGECERWLFGDPSCKMVFWQYR